MLPVAIKNDGTAFKAFKACDAVNAYELVKAYDAEVMDPSTLPATKAYEALTTFLAQLEVPCKPPVAAKLVMLTVEPLKVATDIPPKDPPLLYCSWVSDPPGFPAPPEPVIKEKL